MVEVIKIDNSSIGLRIDKWIKINLIKIPQSLIEKDLRNGKIKVNKKKIKSSYKLNKLDQIYLYNISYKSLLKPKKKFIPMDTIIKETEKEIIEDNSDFIVINKKSGLAVQGGTKVKENLVNILSNSTYFKESKPQSCKFEGSTADANETTLTVVDPTADRTITLPNETGTLITSASAATNAFSIALAAALG